MNTEQQNSQIDIVTMITSPEKGTRLVAAMAAGTATDPASAAVLAERLGKEDDFQVREMLTWAAVQRAGEIDDALAAALEAEDPRVRQQAAHVLSKIGNPAHAEHLAGVVADADPQVAVKAFRAAANTGDARVVPMLLARLGDGDGEQRDGLVRALVSMGATAVPALVEALGSDDEQVREHAADSLGHIGSPDADGAAEALAAAAADSSASVRLMAVSALGQLDGETAEQALVSLAQADDRTVAGVASRFLAARQA